MEDLPEDLVNERFRTLPRIIWGYHYGCGVFHEGNNFNDVRTSVAAPLSRLVHPVLQYLAPGVIPSKEVQSNQIKEDNHPSCHWNRQKGTSRLHIIDGSFWTEWTSAKMNTSMKEFLTATASAAGAFCTGESD